MRKPLFALRVPVFAALFLSLVATNAQAAAELEIYRASISGRNPVVAYDDLSFSWGVRNVGDEDSSGFSAIWYLSEDEDFTENDYEIRVEGSGYAAIPPGEVRTGGRFFDIPADTSNGDYYIGVVVVPRDGSPVITATAGAVTVARPTDLSVMAVLPDGAGRPGGQLDVLVSIHNFGLGVSDSFTIDCYRRGTDHLIGSGDFGPLGRDEGGNYRVSCEIPSDISETEYYVRATVSCQYDEESGNDEAESDSIWIGPSADIAVQSVRATPGSYALGDNVVVISSIKNIGERDSQIYTATFYASTDTTISEDDHRIGRVERDALRSGEADNFQTACRVPFSLTAGRYYIGIIITSQDEYGTASDVGRSTATVQVVTPPGFVYGCAEYQYSENPLRKFPVRCALLQVFAADNNNDPLDDRLLAQTYTDPNGNYGVVLTDARSSAPDIYIKIFTEGVAGSWPNTTSKIGVVKDEVFEEIYSVVSEVYPHPGDDSVVINLRTPGNGEFIVFDSVVEGFIKAKTFFNIELEQAKIFWPNKYNFSYYDPCDSSIHLEQYDARDRDVIMHEYGHLLAEVCGVAQGPVGESGAHYWNMDLRDYPVARTNKHAMNLAFREGWATLFGVATQFGDIGYPGAGDSYYDDGEGGGAFKVDLDNIGEERYSPGKYFENMVASVLWDIFDDKNNEADGKDTLSDPSLTMIWTISQDYKSNDIEDFWNDWFKKYEYEQEMKYIFNTHNMWFAVPE
ncbi:MAG: COG1361 family protein [Planctomycetota bacterium]|jgi:hypothetical protein